MGAKQKTKASRIRISLKASELEAPENRDLRDKILDAGAEAAKRVQLNQSAILKDSVVRQGAKERT
jgi:hypothetical protein